LTLEQFLIIVVKLEEKWMVIGLASGMTPLIDINYYLYLYLCKKNEPFLYLHCTLEKSGNQNFIISKRQNWDSDPSFLNVHSGLFPQLHWIYYVVKGKSRDLSTIMWERYVEMCKIYKLTSKAPSIYFFWCVYGDVILCSISSLLPL